jgi:ferredoxin
MKVKVHRDLCTGHGLCAVKCPEVYLLDDNGYIDADGELAIPAELEAKARRGAVACPEGALIVEI